LAQKKIITDNPNQNEILTVELIEIAYFSKEFKVERELILKKIQRKEILIDILKPKEKSVNDRKSNNKKMIEEHFVEDNLQGVIPRTNSNFHSKIAEDLKKNVEGGLHNQA
jgi:hypothetical protein